MQYSVKLLAAALFALSPASHPALKNFALAQVAQSPAVSLPEMVSSETHLAIQSSPNPGFVANALKQEFDVAYAGTEVEVSAVTEVVTAPIELLATATTAAPADPAPVDPAPVAAGGGGVSWWWLLPLLALLGGLAWLLGRARGAVVPTTPPGVPPTPPPPVDPPVEPAAVAPPERLPVVEQSAIAAVPEPIAPEPIAPEPVVLEPVDIEPAAPEPVEPESIVPESTEAAVPEPVVLEPVDIEPAAPEPVEPESIVPELTEPAAPEPVVLEPVAIEPAAPEPVEPESIVPELTEAAVPEPVVLEPVVIEPAAPEPVEPESIVPELTEAAVPEAVAPDAIVPDLTVPEPADPEPVAIEPVAIEPEPEPLPPPAPALEEEVVTVDEVPPTPEPPVIPPVAPVAVGVVGLAGAAAASLASTEDQSAVEASKFNVVGRPTDGDIDLSLIDDGLPPLPDGYGDSRIVLMPRDPQWAYAYWDTPHTHKEDLRRQGGQHLALRLYDVTGINLDHQAPHGLQQFSCDEMARDWYMQIPVSDRDYQVEIGYLAGDGRWLVLARSNPIRIPPVYPSDWTEEHFLTVTWQENLRGKTIMTLVDPTLRGTDAGLHETLYTMAHAGEALRVDGSLFGSMHHVAGSMAPPISSYAFAAGAGLGVAGALSLSGMSSFVLPGLPAPGALGLPTLSGISGFTMSGFSGLTMSGVGLSSMQMAALSQAELGQLGLTMSGVGMSGVGMSGVGLNLSGLTMSGVGMVAAKPRQFWLVANAELIVYGATEPDASVTVAGLPVQLMEDGTFRFHQSFQDGTADYPIMAVAADGEQSRHIHLTFERRTLERNTNTKDEAQEEWPNS